jgi:hypothetical protein
MSLLPRVTELVREQVAQDFDRLGSDACIAEIIEGLRQDDPEIFDMISSCVIDLGSKIMQGLGMFYRLLIAQCWVDVGSICRICFLASPWLPAIVKEIDEKGIEIFTMECIRDIEETNP